jgi:hypothetical protein
MQLSMSVALIVVWFVLYLLPFDFLMEQSYGSGLVVVIFHTVYFYGYWSGFLCFMGLSIIYVSTSGFVICQIATI